MNKLRIGDTVLLPESKYPGVVGIVIQITEDSCLVNFNGTQQLYFGVDELKLYIS
ncbi:hypothetical protein [Lactococcus petauri]|uniref:hypothetical protein n=1 Tax=Lactococcus petauri TaxID=1940789 RepID=UPI0038544482